MNLLQVLLTRKDEVLAFLIKEPQTVCFTQDYDGWVNCYEINNPGFSSEVWTGTGFIDYIHNPKGKSIKFIKASNHRAGIVSVDTFKAAASPDKQHPAVSVVESILNDVFCPNPYLVANQLLSAIQDSKVPGVKATGGYCDYTTGNANMFNGAPEWATVFGVIDREYWSALVWASGNHRDAMWATKGMDGKFVVHDDALGSFCEELCIKGTRELVK